MNDRITLFLSVDSAMREIARHHREETPHDIIPATIRQRNRTVDQGFKVLIKPPAWPHYYL